MELVDVISIPHPQAQAFYETHSIGPLVMSQWENLLKYYHNTNIPMFCREKHVKGSMQDGEAGVEVPKKETMTEDWSSDLKSPPETITMKEKENSHELEEDLVEYQNEMEDINEDTVGDDQNEREDINE
jgi:hypothetical protein